MRAQLEATDAHFVDLAFRTWATMLAWVGAEEMGLVRRRVDALARGDLFYFNGRTCKHKHVAPKYSAGEPRPTKTADGHSLPAR